MAKRRPNIIDLLILVVVVALVAVWVYKFGVVNQKESAGVTAEASKVTYTAFIDDVRMATVNALHVGDTMYDAKTNTYIGTITDVQYAPKMKNVIDNSGNTILVEYPEYYGVTLTLEGNIIEKEDGYFAEGTVELKANSEMEVYTKYAQPKMKVTSIDI
ncbi:DUF4330 family protein [Anaerotignum lactatifermentans]|uniref:DUF4330 family protein n=1 Tax=Anaerotignum lactatifermentans TaxID=160404 RepID=UPI0024B19DA5|nr:DUF4330 family protein [Anaerotignum lactatifermentans]